MAVVFRRMLVTVSYAHSYVCLGLNDPLVGRMTAAKLVALVFSLDGISPGQHWPLRTLCAFGQTALGRYSAVAQLNTATGLNVSRQHAR